MCEYGICDGINRQNLKRSKFNYIRFVSCQATRPGAILCRWLVCLHNVAHSKEAV